MKLKSLVLLLCFCFYVMQLNLVLAIDPDSVVDEPNEVSNEVQDSSAQFEEIEVPEAEAENPNIDSSEESEESEKLDGSEASEPLQNSLVEQAEAVEAEDLEILESEEADSEFRFQELELPKLKDEKIEVDPLDSQEIFENLEIVNDSVQSEVEIEEFGLNSFAFSKPLLVNWLQNKDLGIVKLAYSEDEVLGWHFFENLNNSEEVEFYTLSKPFKKFRISDKSVLDTVIKEIVAKNFKGDLLGKYSFLANDHDFKTDEFYFKLVNINYNKNYSILTYNLYFDEYEVAGQTLTMYLNRSSSELVSVYNRTDELLLESDIDTLNVNAAKIIKGKIVDETAVVLLKNSIDLSRDFEIEKTLLFNKNKVGEKYVFSLSLGAKVQIDDEIRVTTYYIDPKNSEVLAIKNNLYLDESDPAVVENEVVNEIESEPSESVEAESGNAELEVENTALESDDSIEILPEILINTNEDVMQNTEISTEEAFESVEIEAKYVLKVMTSLEDGSIVFVPNLRVDIDEVEYSTNTVGEVPLMVKPEVVIGTLESGNYKIYDKNKDGLYKDDLKFVGTETINDVRYLIYALPFTLKGQQAYFNLVQTDNYFKKLFDSTNLSLNLKQSKVYVDSEMSSEMFAGCLSFYQVSTIQLHYADGVNCGLTSHVFAADVVVHEYTHYILSQAGNFDYYLETASAAIHEAISDYYAAVITNDPLIGEGALIKSRDLSVEKVWQNSTDTYVKAEVLGSLFWALRQQIGPKFDEILINSTLVTTHTYHDLLVQLLLNDDNNATLLDGTPNQEVIVNQFAKSGLIDSNDLLFDPNAILYLVPQDLLFTETLTMSIAGIEIDFGQITSAAVEVPTYKTILTVNTNATNGFILYASSTGMLNSVANFNIPTAVSSAISTSSDSGFGIYLENASQDLVVNEGFDNDSTSDLAVTSTILPIAGIDSLPNAAKSVDVRYKVFADSLAPAGAYSGNLQFNIVAEF